MICLPAKRRARPPPSMFLFRSGRPRCGVGRSDKRPAHKSAAEDRRLPSRTVGPRYQFIFLLALARFSPVFPEVGTNARASRERLIRNFLYSLSISANRFCENSARSILLTTTINCLIPSRRSKYAWRRLCSRTPSFAAITRTAASARDAPVIMFFKNSLWPGASMMT